MGKTSFDEVNDRLNKKMTAQDEGNGIVWIVDENDIRYQNGVQKAKDYDLDNLNAIYTCALRYAFGRMTYMPGLVTDYIKRHADTVTDKNLFVMTRDLREEIETAERIGDKHYGMDCDKRTWLDFYSWLLEEKRRRDADCEK